MALCVFYNGSELVRPGLSYAWDYGVPERFDGEFNEPDSGA